MKKEIKLKRRRKPRGDVILLEDNALVHTAQVAVAKAANSGFELLSHSAYSPGLGPSDFFLFPKVNSHQRGREFGNNDMIICVVWRF